MLIESLFVVAKVILLDIGNRLPTNINDNRPVKRTLVLAEDPFIAVIMIYQILGTDYQPTSTDDGVG